jgi:hypothetical protein
MLIEKTLISKNQKNLSLLTYNNVCAILNIYINKQ